MRLKIRETSEKIDYVSVGQDFNYYKLKIIQVIKYIALYVNG